MVKMLLGALKIPAVSESQGFKDIASLGDLAGFINAAAKANIVNKGDNFYPSKNATRGEAFKVAANAAKLAIVDDATDEGDDILCEILGTCTTDTTTGTTDTGTTDTTTGTTNTGIVLSGDLEVSLSSATPTSATFPSSAE